MNCRDCLHFKACYEMATANGAEEFNTLFANKCEDFTAHSEWVHLPCRVGDKVYIVNSRTSDDKNLYIIEDVAKRIVFDKSEDTGVIHSRIEFFNTYSVSDWLFQNIFLTREEAEKAAEKKI